MYDGAGTIHSANHENIISTQTTVCYNLICCTCTHCTVIQPGFQIDSELLNGRNALHYAADYGQAEVIKYLVGKGAKLDVSVLCLSPICVCVCVCVCVCACVCASIRESFTPQKFPAILYYQYSLSLPHAATRQAWHHSTLGCSI